MKKTVAVNISGTEFRLDEDAYELLNQYLKNLRNHFASNFEGTEILSDIESRIAEMLNEKIGPSKQIIVLQDVEHVIAVMGRPEDFGDNEDESTKTNANTQEEYSTGKKLFRDGDDNVIGGVCSGIAAYFGIDVIWIRLFFVLFAFFYSSGFWIYIIFWIVIPKAKSAADKLAMKGKPINVKNIEKTVQTNLNDIEGEIKDKWKSGNFDKAKKAGAGFFNLLTQLLHLFVKFGLKIVGALLLIGTTIAFISIAGFFLFDLSSLNFDFDNEVQSSNFNESLQLFINNPMVTYSLKIALFIVSAMPILAFMLLAVVLLTGWKRNVKYFSLGILIMWFIGIVLTVILSLSTANEFRNTNQVSQKIEIIAPQNSKLYLKAIENNQATGTKMNLLFDDGVIFNTDKNNMYFYYPELTIDESVDGKYYIEIEKSSRGNSNAQAKALAEEIKFEWKQEDTTLYLSSFFSAPNSNAFRFQTVKIKLWVPKTGNVEIDEKVQKMFEVFKPREIMIIDTEEEEKNAQKEALNEQIAGIDEAIMEIDHQMNDINNKDALAGLKQAKAELERTKAKLQKEAEKLNEPNTKQGTTY